MRAQGAEHMGGAPCCMIARMDDSSMHCRHLGAPIHLRDVIIMYVGNRYLSAPGCQLLWPITKRSKWLADHLDGHLPKP